MTIALCLFCGHTKRGALCPCGHCRAEATGDPTIDVLFSDRQMSVTTLTELGGVVEILCSHCDDPDVRFWAFVSHVSDHPARILAVDPPAEFADRVADTLRAADLPVVDIDLTPGPGGLHPHTVAIPRRLFEALAEDHDVDRIRSVELRVDDGRVIRGVLITEDDVPKLATRVDDVPRPAQFVAIRPAPVLLPGWLVRRPWIQANR